MKAQQAAEILNIHGDLTPESIKLAYRHACSKYHPDRGGSTEMMQAVNAAYECLKDFTGNINQGECQQGYGEALNEAIQAIITLPGLIIEVCGLWLWISGDTRTHKEALKAAGFRWASKKKQWYFRPDDWVSANRGEWSMDEIRAKHGSESIKSRRAAELHA